MRLATARITVIIRFGDATLAESRRSWTQSFDTAALIDSLGIVRWISAIDALVAALC